MLALLGVVVGGVGYRVSQAQGEGGGETTFTTKATVCEVPGYCPVCSSDFKTVAYCGVAYSRFCPGTQKITIATTPVQLLYDGKVEEYLEDSISLPSACTQ